MVSLMDLMVEKEREAASRLARLREAHGFTQEGLAHAAKVSSKSISRWETGEVQPRRRTVEQVAEVLGVEPRELQANLDEVVSISDRLERMERQQETMLAAVAELADSVFAIQTEIGARAGDLYAEAQNEPPAETPVGTGRARGRHPRPAKP